MISLHFGAIILAAIAAFLLGWLWYSPLLFQTAWIRLSGLTMPSSEQKPNPALLLLGFVATLTLGLVTWEQKSWKLYVLHNSYHLLSFLVIGAILFGLR